MQAESHGERPGAAWPGSVPNDHPRGILGLPLVLISLVALETSLGVRFSAPLPNHQGAQRNSLPVTCADHAAPQPLSRLDVWCSSTLAGPAKPRFKINQDQHQDHPKSWLIFVRSANHVLDLRLFKKTRINVGVR